MSAGAFCWGCIIVVGAGAWFSPKSAWSLTITKKERMERLHRGVWMAAAAAEVLTALEARDAVERALGLAESVRLRPIGPRIGPFLALITRLRRPRRLIEIGSFPAYNTTWLALGAQPFRAEIHTVELEVERAAAAGATLSRAGLAEQVQIWQGDAGEVIPSLESPFDLAFIDGEKAQYGAYFKALQRKLSLGALVLADNVLSHSASVADDLGTVVGSPRWVSVTIAVDGGIEVSYRVRCEKPALVDPLERLLFVLAGGAAPKEIMLLGPAALAHRRALAAAAVDLGGAVPLTDTTELPPLRAGDFVVADPATLGDEVPCLPPGAALIVLGALAPRRHYDVAGVALDGRPLTLVVAAVRN